MKLKKPAALATGIGALAGTGMAIAVPQAAVADSPIIDNGGGGGCQGQWRSGPNQFRIQDLHDDDEHCYVNYGRTAAEVQNSDYRVSHRCGPDCGWENFNVEVKNWPHIRFRVCEHRGGGPDVCGNITGEYAF
jgi:hypothetical protein